MSNRHSQGDMRVTASCLFVHMWEDHVGTKCAFATGISCMCFPNKLTDDSTKLDSISIDKHKGKHKSKKKQARENTLSVNPDSTPTG